MRWRQPKGPHVIVEIDPPYGGEDGASYGVRIEEGGSFLGIGEGVDEEKGCNSEEDVIKAVRFYFRYLRDYRNRG